MSETEVPKNTAVVKEKNPKRVEQGKRLVAISKAAKERKPTTPTKRITTAAWRYLYTKWRTTPVSPILKRLKR